MPGPTSESGRLPGSGTTGSVSRSVVAGAAAGAGAERTVGDLLKKAFALGASDVHLEP
jgi:hypothetical protein